MTVHTVHTRPLGAAAAPTSTPGTRRVMDATTRMLHWLMALSFTGAYITAESEHWRLVHVTLGYTLAGIVLARLLWGLLGPRAVRLAGLWARVRGLPTWLQSLAAVRSWAAWCDLLPSGRNLLMGLAMVLMLALVLPLSLSGYAVWDEWGGEWLEKVHEWVGNAMLWVVLVHIGLIVLMSVLQGKNQALPMLTGRVPGRGPDSAKKNHGWLALLILAAVLAFWGWQWQSAPQQNAEAATPFSLENTRSNHHDDD
ncbi:MAG: cytochrome b/b6 domain-containing protein [Giesbergeria sp.]|uniref:cytochrome b/b6 domain-containing protein n=1 Tax=Giesbergeria sp. TaxID=2818473 RepID=UPI00262EC61B|nr:cytochrome b/b6 domain-containing protein [Giesbergeria sp.]MDD2608581.1 cytochrome b/b6 domain-containing protein [Giesbergeria sp.]